MYGVPMGLKSMASQPFFVYKLKEVSKKANKDKKKTMNGSKVDTGTSVSNAFDILGIMVEEDVADCITSGVPLEEKVRTQIEYHGLNLEKVTEMEDHGQNLEEVLKLIASNKTMMNQVEDVVRT